MKLVPSSNTHRLATVFFWLTCLATVACGSDGAGVPKDESTGNSAKKDAGSTRTKDAGRGKDSGAAEPEDEDEDEVEDEDEPADDSETGSDDDDDSKEDSADEDTKPMAKDAGTTPSKADAGKSESKDAGSTAPAAGESCDELTYAKFGEMFLKTYCYECHSTKGMLGGIALDTPAGVAKSMSNLKKMVIPRADGKMPAMPKGGNPKLTDEERIKFGKWMDCGGK